MFRLIAKWRQEREAIRELSRLSDRELSDLGIARADIASMVSGASTKRTTELGDEAGDVMAPSWAAHNRTSLAA